jgi:hypothetical protein
MDRYRVGDAIARASEELHSRFKPDCFGLGIDTDPFEFLAGLSRASHVSVDCAGGTVW